MSVFCCPICKKELTCFERAYQCENGHHFDQAKEGYVHLLPVSGKRTAMPGDNKEMVTARSLFLEQGYYAHLAKLLSDTACTYLGKLNTPTMLDSGCGEGYYTNAIYRALKEKGTHVNICGIDLSKDAVRRAAKRVKDGAFAVASAYHLPILSASVDLVLNCFSPMCEEEFARVLRPGGYLLYVVPAARHLWQLKEVLYEKPYLNEEKECHYEGFDLIEKLHTTADRLFADSVAIRSLFAMTPYAYRTPHEGRLRMEALSELLCTCAFNVYVYRRKN